MEQRTFKEGFGVGPAVVSCILGSLLPSLRTEGAWRIWAAVEPACPFQTPEGRLGGVMVPASTGNSSGFGILCCFGATFL